MGLAEYDFLPKRIGIWPPAVTTSAASLYGPGNYDGGGSIDPKDKSRFYSSPKNGPPYFLL